MIMSLKGIKQTLVSHKHEMAKKHSLTIDQTFDSIYSAAWTAKIMEGYPAVEEELQRILEERKIK